MVKQVVNGETSKATKPQRPPIKPVPAAKVPAVRKAKGTEVALPTDWEAEMARYVERSAKVAEVSAGAGAWLTFQGAQLRFRGVEVPDNTTELVVLDEVIENLYYDDAFDPDSPKAPVCFALARTLNDMVPHESAPDKQHATCKGCPQNAWGSSDTGKGKACKNTVRLAMIAWDNGDPESLEKAEIAFAKLPVTSVKNWSTYSRGLGARYKKPPFTFVTRLNVVPDKKTQFQVTFETVSPVPKQVLGVILQKVKEAEGVIIPDLPYQQMDREEDEAPKRSKKPGKKPKY